MQENAVKIRASQPSIKPANRKKNTKKNSLSLRRTRVLQLLCWRRLHVPLKLPLPLVQAPYWLAMIVSVTHHPMTGYTKESFEFVVFELEDVVELVTVRD